MLRTNTQNFPQKFHSNFILIEITKDDLGDLKKEFVAMKYRLTELEKELSDVKDELEQFESLNKSHQDQLNNQQKEIDSLIPLGFLYTQFPSQSSPDVLWPNLKWTEVTQSYTGLFFRAEGGNSSSYGELQLASAPHLAQVHQHNSSDKLLFGENIINLEQGIETKKLYNGGSNRIVAHVY